VTNAPSTDQAQRVCNICGGTTFGPGFRGRVSNGRPPSCDRCQSSERHRIAHLVFVPLKPLLKLWQALHFAPDRSVEPGWFKEYRRSTFGGPTSLDMMATGLPDGAYDIIMSNHVLEHVPDYLQALRETLRVVGPNGIVQAMVPAQSWTLNDWGFADPDRNAHYREFGADFGLSICHAVAGAHALGVSAPDPVTDVVDTVYLSPGPTRHCAPSANF